MTGRFEDVSDAAPTKRNDKASAVVIRGRHRIVVFLCCSSVFMVSLDSTIVNTALPSMQVEFGVNVIDLQWVMNSYTITLASFLIFAGSVGDRFGRRRVFRVGLTLFCIGSLACSLASSVTALVTFRILQALGGSMLNPVAMSIIVHEFTDRGLRAKVVGVWGSVVGLSMAVAPLLGGLVVELLTWRGVYWINVPIGLAVLAFSRRIPESRGLRKSLDPVGQTMVIVLFLTLVVGLMNPETTGGFPFRLFLLSTILIATLLAAWELHRSEALIDFRLFSIPGIPMSIASAVVGFAALSGFLFLNSLYLQNARGLTPFGAGLMLLPMAIAACFVPILSGAMVARLGPRIPLCISGLGFLSSGFLIGTVHSPALWLLGIAYAVFGCGFGMMNPPVTTTVVSSVPPSQSGLASAIVSTARQAGAAVGVAVLGSGMTTVPQNIAESLLRRQWLICVAGAVIAVGALTMTPKRLEVVSNG